MNSRYYDSQVGRFISPDVSLNDDTTGNNNFVYCGNNPTIYKDSNGKWFYVALAGGIFSAVAQIVSNVLPVAEGEEQPVWYDGVLSAFAGGAFSGAFAGACISIPAFSSLSVVAQNVIGNT